MKLYWGKHTCAIGIHVLLEEKLYDERFVTFGEDDVYEQSDAAGFIRLYSLPDRVRAIRDRELAAKAVAPVSSADEAPVLAASWQD